MCWRANSDQEPRRSAAKQHIYSSSTRTMKYSSEVCLTIKASSLTPQFNIRKPFKVLLSISLCSLGRRGGLEVSGPLRVQEHTLVFGAALAVALLRRGSGLTPTQANAFFFPPCLPYLLHQVTSSPPSICLLTSAILSGSFGRPRPPCTCNWRRANRLS